MMTVTVVPWSPLVGEPDKVKEELSNVSQLPLSPMLAVIELMFFEERVWPSNKMPSSEKVYETLPPMVPLTYSVGLLIIKSCAPTTTLNVWLAEAKPE